MLPTIISFVSPCLSRSFFLFSFSLFSLFLFPDTFLLRIQPACHSRQSFATLYTALHPAAFQIRVSRSTDRSSTSFNFLAKGKRHHSSQLLWRLDIYNIHSGYAFVYLVRAQPSNQLYALKKIQCPPGDQEAVSEAMREVDMYRMFQHENIISVLVCCPLLLSHFVVLFTA